MESTTTRLDEPWGMNSAPTGLVVGVEVTGGQVEKTVLREFSPAATIRADR
jgi:hypothetical protein